MFYSKFFICGSEIEPPVGANARLIFWGGVKTPQMGVDAFHTKTYEKHLEDLLQKQNAHFNPIALAS